MIRGSASLALSITLMAVFFLLVTTKPAHAYIDAGSAGFMLQMLLAGGIGALVATKVFWHNITGKLLDFFAMIKGSKKDSE